MILKFLRENFLKYVDQSQATFFPTKTLPLPLDVVNVNE